jgi:hypothetical protein
MKIQRLLKTILIWLPSLTICCFYIPNALDKIMNQNTADKVVESPFIMMATGIFLLLAVGLFLYQKTVHIGSLLLALYMTLIVCIHMYKGKSYEVTILIVMSTIFAGYLRRPQQYKIEK